jgi:hypothetical protein
VLSQKQEFKPTTHYPIEELLVKAASYEASDPRDKIYSLLGLVSTEYAIAADYTPSNSLARVITDISRQIIEVRGTLDILYKTLDSYNEEFSLHLPSWAPDWTARRSLGGDDGWQAGTTSQEEWWSKIFEADDSDPPIWSKGPSFSDHRDSSARSTHLRMHVRGLFLCAIEQLRADEKYTYESIRVADSDLHSADLSLWCLEQFPVPIVLQKMVGNGLYQIPKHPQLFVARDQGRSRFTSWYDLDFFRKEGTKRSWIEITIT